MTYEDLIKTLTEIVDNKNIYKENLTLEYQLSEINHKKMYEHLFYRSNIPNATLEIKDEFEVEIEGVLIKFISSKK